MRFALLAAALLLAHPAATCALPALYGSIGEDHRHWGAHATDAWPFLDARGQVVESVARQTARFNRVVLEAGNLLQRPEIAYALRYYNPAIKLIGLVGGQVWGSVWLSTRLEDSLSNCVPLDVWRAVSPLPHWHTIGKCGYYDPFKDCARPWAFSWYGTNYADRATVEAMSRVWIARVIANPMFDGVFLDLCPGPISWSQSPRDSLDYRAMGFRAAADYDSAWAVNRTWLVRSLRGAAPQGFAIIVNGPYEPDRASGVGWMRENFPRQAGGSWETNMLGYAGTGGYLNDNRGSLLNVLLCDTTQHQLARFALGSAALGDGDATFACRNDRPASDDRSLLWFPEMAIETGAAYGPAYRWRGSWRRDFAHGSWLVNPAAQDANWVPR